MMLKKEELLRTREYWMTNIQHEIYYQLKSYMEENNINQTELAKELGFSKGYISQIMNGEFNHSLKKLIDLSLAINRAPIIQFRNLDEYIDKEVPDQKAKTKNPDFV